MPSFLASTPLLTSRKVAPAAVASLFVLVAVLGGVVIGSGNFVLTALVLATLVGGLLLGSTGIVVWAIIIGTLALSGPLIMHLPELRQLPWLFSMLGLLLAGASTLYIGSGAKLRRNDAPPHVAMAVAFVVYVIATSFIGEGALDEKISAMKRWFQFWGLLLIFATMPFTVKQVRRWVWALLAIALIQLPFALYQRIELVPLRLNMPDRVVPIDIVTGTLEAELWGAGNNNTMAYFLVVAAVGLIVAYRDGALRLSRCLLGLALVGIPLGLGETKMVLLFLPVAFLVAFGDLVRKQPVKFAFASAFAAGVIALFGFIYVAFQDSDGRSISIESRIIENLEYNIGDKGHHGGGSLNRSNVVPFWWRQHGLQDPIRTTLGHGIGASFSSNSDPGVIDRQYSGYSVGLTGLSTLLWDVGILGAAMYIGILCVAGIAGVSLMRRSRPGLDHAFCSALTASVFLQVLLVLVADLMFQAPSTQVLLMLTLGMIAWRWRSTEPV